MSQKFKEVLTEDDNKQIKNAVKEMVASLNRVAAEKQLQKDIAEKIKDDELLPPKIFKKLSQLAFDDAADKFSAETTEILDHAETLGIYSHDPYEKKETI